MRFVDRPRSVYSASKLSKLLNIMRTCSASLTLRSSRNALLGEPAVYARHAHGPLLVHPPHDTADRVLVQLRHRAQRAIPVAVRGKHLGSGAEPCVQVVARVGLVFCVDEPRVAGPRGELTTDGVEQP